MPFARPGARGENRREVDRHVSDQVLRGPSRPEDGADADGMTTSHAPRSPKDPGRSRSAGKARATRNARSSDRAPAPARSGAAATAVGFAVAAVVGGVIAWSSGCRNEPPPGFSTDHPPRANSLPAPPRPAQSAVASAAPSGSASAPVASAAPAEKPY